MNELESYIFGLLITDGNLYLTDRNRGRVSLEISESDKDIVLKLINIIPNSHIRYRTRNTNFEQNYKSISFVNNRLEFRTKLINQGFPTSDKTNLASIPNQDFSKYDFWRGVIDGDGSLGFTGINKPFISLVTKSEKLKENFLNFLSSELNIIKNLNRNKRDNIYNIVITNENAVKLSKLLYYDQCSLYLDRKYKKALEIQKWCR